MFLCGFCPWCPRQHNDTDELGNKFFNIIWTHLKNVFVKDMIDERKLEDVNICL